MPVSIEAVKSVPLRDATEYVGVLRSRQSVQIQPLVEGHVSKILVSSGDEVQPRAPLIDIDPSRQRAAVSSQQAIHQANVASLDLARKQYDRIERLFNRGAATRQDFDQAQNGVRQAEANASATEAQTRAQAVELRYYQVAAPVGGTVGDIPVRVGDLVTSQTLLTTLDDNSALEAYVDVPLERAATLKLGTLVEIVDVAGEVIAPSEVSFVSPRADPATQMVLVKASVDNRAGRLRAAQFVRARIVWRKYDGPVVPVLSVQRRAGQAFVWVVSGTDGALTAALRAIQIGPIQGQSYPVTGGLRAGERIVVSGVQKLRPGAHVAPLPAPPAGQPPSKDGG
ncbi:MAG TPA: efflux RND transporter periplasmic adaptor subunit [Polyangia bacterium]|jgi:RND family efflux transporter MFP subunit|nr:efflux RND transporter periplasmic adaptor subunit [Polyangia bacterium]